MLYPSIALSNRCASTHFGENQLAPSSFGISPLFSAHLTIFQHRRVRTSTWFCPSFILAKNRSPGFGSKIYDLIKSLSLWLQIIFLTLPHTLSRRLILQQARGQSYMLLPQFVSLVFHEIPLFRVICLSLAVLLFTIGHLGIFSLTRWSSQIHTE